MLTEVRCTITELYERECAHCRQLPDPAPLDDEFDTLAGAQPAVAVPFPAAYRGTCPECGDDIEVRELIRANGRGGYVHEKCGDTR